MLTEPSDSKLSLGMEKRYLRLLLLFVFVFISLVSGINILVDPYRVLNFPDIRWLNADRMEYGAYGRMGKALRVMKVKPATVILGASSAEVGFDPEHKAWQYRPVFNLGLSGANLYEIFRYLQHSHAASPLKQALISIVPSSINAYQGERPDFLEDRLLVNARGDRAGLVARRGYIFNHLLSVDALVASGRVAAWNFFQDASTQSVFRGKTYTQKGRRVLGEAHRENIVKSGGYNRRLRNGLEAFMGYLWFPLPERKFCPAASNRDTLKVFEDILRFGYENGISLVFVVDPYHVEYSASMMELGLYDIFGHWLQGAVALNSRMASTYGADPFAIWDFSDVGNITTEPVPSASMPEAHMKNYYDAPHFDIGIGNRILDTVLGPRRAAADEGNRFGVKLEPGNITRHLDRARALLMNWMAENTDPMRDLRALIRDTEHERAANPICETPPATG